MANALARSQVHLDNLLVQVDLPEWNDESLARMRLLAERCKTVDQAVVKDRQVGSRKQSSPWLPVMKGSGHNSMNGPYDLVSLTRWRVAAALAGDRSVPAV